MTIRSYFALNCLPVFTSISSIKIPCRKKQDVFLRFPEEIREKVGINYETKSVPDSMTTGFSYVQHMDQIASLIKISESCEQKMEVLFLINCDLATPY